MFGGEFLTSFVPEVGVQERMKEHGKDPKLWKIKYEEHFMNLRISFLKSQSDVIKSFGWKNKYENNIFDVKSLYFQVYF